MINEPALPDMIGVITLSVIAVLRESTKPWLARSYQSTPSNRLVTMIVLLSADKQDRPLGKDEEMWQGGGIGTNI